MLFLLRFMALCGEKNPQKVCIVPFEPCSSYGKNSNMHTFSKKAYTIIGNTGKIHLKSGYFPPFLPPLCGFVRFLTFTQIFTLFLERMFKNQPENPLF